MNNEVYTPVILDRTMWSSEYVCGIWSWLLDNCVPDMWVMTHISVWFRDPGDMIAFKLKFGL
jgi:hypothetical protein